MEIQLVRNDTILINNEILAGINKNAKVFNMSEEALYHLNTSFEEGNEIPLIHPYVTDRQAYEIISDNNQVGIILLSLDEDPEYGWLWEVIILVFESFQGNGISKKAIKMIIELNSEKSFISIIHTDNEAKDGLKRLLSELEFQLIQEEREYITLILKK
ncbi:hypothetical protein [Bacillus wiedmannii]|uniref:hypothetical protein n=1 Tax=Bacillus wiedmannii TaxID=1890302 RepID=UPI0007DB48D2|nr:hypothetical protein [Bacillus wiedmannii]OAK46926.1 hypothetical protein A6285_15350 [Bacillus wiedmannii]HDR7661460.1 hypothetical protein [Bacillus wiedmannii]